jgi:hypothetical protein
MLMLMTVSIPAKDMPNLSRRLERVRCAAQGVGLPTLGRALPD